MNTVSHNIATTSAGPGVARVSARGTFGFPELSGTPINYDLFNTTSPCYVQELTLSNGNNTITIPDAAGGVCIIPPADNSQIVTLKGVNGDTGIALHSTVPSLICFREAQASFVLNVTASVAGFKLVWF